MNPEEYARLEEIEAAHWFYVGKRRIVFGWLDQLDAIRPGRTLVDCGAGTGRFIQEVSNRCTAIAVDDHDESIIIAQKRLGAEAVRRGSCSALPFAGASIDMVTALDVIEHIEDDKGAVLEMTRILKPGGVMIVTAPAFQLLWSDWDVALHHFRRYRREELRNLLTGAGLEVIHCEYINVLAFPIVLAVRKWRTWFPPPAGNRGVRAEEKMPPIWLNTLLRVVFVALAQQHIFSFPFGVGVLAVARRAINTSED